MIKKLFNSPKFNKILFNLNKSSFNKNSKFDNLHNGQTCYIFGNGESLKSFDFSSFNDRTSIGCNSLFFHNDFKKLNCLYYQIPPALFFLPYFKYYNRLQYNPVSNAYKKKIHELTRTNFFTSIYNRPFVYGKNIFYEHHFGNRIPNINHCNLTHSFSFMASATDAMIGMAIYMGFKEAILVGVDYTFENSVSQHFFEKGKGVYKNESKYKEAFFNKVQQHINLKTITLDGINSDCLDSINYKEYTGKDEEYKENNEIVNEKYLNILNSLGFYNI